MLERLLERLENILEAIEGILGSHNVEHVLINFFDFVDVYLVCRTGLDLVERGKGHDVHLCVVFELYRIVPCSLFLLSLDFLVQLLLFFLEQHLTPLDVPFQNSVEIPRLVQIVRVHSLDELLRLQLVVGPLASVLEVA